jgi:hypothetical protein
MGSWLGRERRVPWVLALSLSLAVLALGLVLHGEALAPAGTVEGLVRDASGPVAGARVRVRNTENATLTDADGLFGLGGLDEGLKIEVAAWAGGYYIASAYVTPTVAGLTLTLRPYHQVDNPGYTWTSPISGTSPGACGNCHPMIISQWISNAHGTAVSNPRFYSLYNGTDVSGAVIQGDGYLDDFPGTSGTCTNCHAPGLGVDSYLTTNMNEARDQITAGIHCDYCHKIGGVYLDPWTGSVYANVPGTLSQRVLRPPQGDNIFFGPYDDVHDPDTYLPLISESQFCAPCHQFSFWGTPIYESYDEWLASPYAEQGVTCQDCHMPPNGDTHFALPEVGGLAHRPETIPSHQQLGATSVELLQDTVALELVAEELGGEVLVTVVITNTGAGHHVPTDYPGRHMILAVEASAGGQPLALLEGGVVPAWCGEQAGLPGKAYAKVLRDVLSGEAPVVTYWKQTLVDGDNRIPALAADRSSYRFVAPTGGGAVTVQASLRLRRVFQPLMDAKGWDMVDVVMEEAEVTLSD